MFQTSPYRLLGTLGVTFQHRFGPNDRKMRVFRVMSDVYLRLVALKWGAILQNSHVWPGADNGLSVGCSNFVIRIEFVEWGLSINR